MNNKNPDFITDSIKHQLRCIHYNGIKKISAYYNDRLLITYDYSDCQDIKAIEKKIKEDVQKYLDDAHKEELRQYVCFLNSYFDPDYNTNYVLNSSKNGVKDGDESKEAHELGIQFKYKIDLKEVGLDDD